MYNLSFIKRLTNYRGETPLLYALLLFTVGLTLNGFMFAWFTIKSGSMWPAVILHGAGNFFIQSVFDHLMVESNSTKYLTGEFGIIGLIIVIITAYIFWRMRSQLPEENYE